MTKEKETKGLGISAKSFVLAIAVIFGLMVLCYVLTFIVPTGVYDRVMVDGTLTVVENTYHAVETSGLPFYKWVLSPFLVLGTDAGLSVIFVIVFLFIIGGIFASLNNCGLMQYMIDLIVHEFRNKRYALMAVMVFFFMTMGSLVGTFEEIVPLVPLVVAVAVHLGFDVLTGLGMSVLAVGCGFSAGVFNPFTIGIAQTFAGLPMFSGFWLRLVAFVLIYALLMGFLVLHAKRVEKPVDVAASTFTKNEKFDKGAKCFAIIMGVGIAIVISSGFITVLQQIPMIAVVAVFFLAAGVSSALASGMSGRDLLKTSLVGAKEMIPAAAMILMASSIRYILEEGVILDTILYGAFSVAETLPKWTIILFVYAVVLVLNFFIASASAKAAMLIPLLCPLAQMTGVPVQLCIVAFAFGDGFSNVFYPTNPVLLISLGLENVGYGKWVKYSWLFQLLNLVLTAGILLFGFAVGYC